MAIYTSKTRIDLEDVGYSNKITNKAILKILENAGARQSETIHFGLNDMENVGFSWILLGWKVKILKREIKSRNLCTLIEVDGGINEITAKIAAKNGADICIAGTSIFKSNDMKFAIDSLK